MTFHFVSLLLASLICVAGLAFSALLVMQAQARELRLKRRLAAAIAVHAPGREEEFAALSRRQRPSLIQRVIHQLAGLFGFDPGRLDLYPLRWWLVLPLALGIARLAAALLAGLVGSVAVLLTPLFWVLLSRFFYHWNDARRRQALFKQFPDALAMIVRSVRVGIPVIEGLRVVARESSQPTAEEFSRLADKVAIGVALEEALREIAFRSDLPEYRFFATALSLQAKTGGGLTETLENLAEVIRKRVALRARGFALASEARTSAGILGALPLVSGGGLAVVNPHYLAMLFTQPEGQKVLGLAVLMLGTGLMVMRSIINRSLST